MSNSANKNFYDFSNDELIRVINRLKIYCKKNQNLNFKDLIKTIPPVVKTTGNKQHYFLGTINRYISKIRRQKPDNFAQERTYFIKLIENACKNLNIKLNENNEFVTEIASNKEIESFKFEGNYYLYGPTSNEDGISKHPLQIDKNGKVKMILGDINSKGGKNFIEGDAMYDNNSMLSITFLNENNKLKFRHYLFSVLENFPPYNLRRAFGVSQRANMDKRPVARVEVLLFTNDNINDDNSVYEEFKIDTTLYRKEDIRLDGMLNWLAGKYNRRIIAPSKPNRNYSRRREEEYVNIHFNSACYLALREKYQDSLMDLYQAYLHGFNDIESLDKEINSGGCLEELYKKDIKSSIRHSKQYHISLTCKQLVEKIRSRAEHIKLLPTIQKIKS